LAVDVETTGLIARADKIIELAARLFWSDLDGVVLGVGEPVSWLEDPLRPLTPDITRLTGLSDKDLVGQAINSQEFEKMWRHADLVIAHNAEFDRKFLDARFPNLPPRLWLCSCHDVPWEEHGFNGRNLGWLLAQAGQFAGGDLHRAANDVEAMLALIQTVFPQPDGRTALSHAYATANLPMSRISAIGAAFSTKDLLRARGYRWRAVERSWSQVMLDDELDEEREWLAVHVYSPGLRPSANGPLIEPVPWTDRHKTAS
jgi:DNA polymerase-3 subunit epsilon